MKQIFKILLLAFAWLGASYGENAKIVYANVSFPQAESFYVGQSIAVKYTITLFSGANLVSVDWVNLDKSNLTLKNPSAKWNDNDDGTLTNTYVYQINHKDALIPQLKITASAGDYTEETLTSGAKINAIELSSNPRYIGVLASAFDVVDFRAKPFNTDSNIMLFQFESKGANLSAMKIGDYAKQGLESSKVVDGVIYGIYYVIVDKNLRNLSFDYFNLAQNQFVNITLPINIVPSGVEEIGDIKPRNTILMFKNLLLGGAICFFIFVGFIFKRLRKPSLVVITALGVALAYSLFFNATSGVAQAGAQISIIPTKHSTIAEVIQKPTKVAIIGEYEGYYKIMIDSRVGWIRKEYVGKN